jgi:hypothetical protein
VRGRELGHYEIQAGARVSEHTISPPEDKLPSIPPVVSWAIALVSLVLLPYNANIFTYLADPQHSYAEFAIRLPGKTLVVAKNSGATKINLLDSIVEMQVCQPFDAEEAFEQRTRGLIPPSSYAVVMVPKGSTAERRVILNDIEIKTSRLRLTTPIEETQYYFAASVVIGVAIMLTTIISRWYFEDALSRSGK